MNLDQAICDALALTRDLAEALHAGDLQACGSLLEQRQEAMAAFARTHQCAPEAEQTACRDQIHDLVAADGALQAAAVQAHAAAGAQLRASVGASPQFGGSYDRTPELACLDRKA